MYFKVKEAVTKKNKEQAKSQHQVKEVFPWELPFLCAKSQKTRKRGSFHDEQGSIF